CGGTQTGSSMPAAVAPAIPAGRFRARSSQPAADAGSRRAGQAGDVPEAVPNRRYRQSLNPIFSIVSGSGVSSKAGLELRESRIESRLAHLVVATAVAAGLSDCPRMQEIVRPSGACQLFVHGPPPVVGIRPEREDDDARRRFSVHPGNPYPTGIPHRFGDDLELPA